MRFYPSQRVGGHAGGGNGLRTGFVVQMCIRDRLMAKDARIEALMDRLIDKCPNCELAKAANKSLLDDE